MIDLPVGSNSLEESEVLSLLGFLSGGWSLPMLLVLNRESTTTWGYKKNLAQQPQHLSIMCGHILHGSLHNLHAGEASEGITVTHKTNNCSLHHWEHCCLKSSKCMTHGECVYCIIWQREREKEKERERMWSHSAEEGRRKDALRGGATRPDSPFNLGRLYVWLPILAPTVKGHCSVHSERQWWAALRRGTPLSVTLCVCMCVYTGEGVGRGVCLVQILKTSVLQHTRPGLISLLSPCVFLCVCVYWIIKMHEVIKVSHLLAFLGNLQDKEKKKVISLTVICQEFMTTNGERRTRSKADSFSELNPAVIAVIIWSSSAE